MDNVEDAALARAMQENAEPEDSAVKQPAAFKLFAKELPSTGARLLQLS